MTNSLKELCALSALMLLFSFQVLASPIVIKCDDHQLGCDHRDMRATPDGLTYLNYKTFEDTLFVDIWDRKEVRWEKKSYEIDLKDFPRNDYYEGKWIVTLSDDKKVLNIVGDQYSHRLTDLFSIKRVTVSMPITPNMDSPFTVKESWALYEGASANYDSTAFLHFTSRYGCEENCTMAYSVYELDKDENKIVLDSQSVRADGKGSLKTGELNEGRFYYVLRDYREMGTGTEVRNYTIYNFKTGKKVFTIPLDRIYDHYLSVRSFGASTFVYLGTDGVVHWVDLEKGIEFGKELQSIDLVGKMKEAEFKYEILTDSKILIRTESSSALVDFKNDKLVVGHTLAKDGKIYFRYSIDGTAGARTELNPKDKGFFRISIDDMATGKTIYTFLHIFAEYFNFLNPQGDFFESRAW